MTSAKWMGIRSRSFLAFAVLTLFTLLASLVGWVSYNRIGDELDRVVQVNMNSLQLMANLKEYGTSITVRAPTLLTAKDEITHQQIQREVNLDVEAMLNLLSEDTKQHRLVTPATTLIAQINTLNDVLEKLNKNVARQLQTEAEKMAFSQKLRWLASTFLNDIDSVTQSSERLSDNEQQAFNGDLRALYRIKADVNLLTNLVDRVQHLPDLSSLIAINIHSNEVVESLGNDLSLLSTSQDYLAIKQAVLDLTLLAKGHNNIFSIRRQERNLVEKSQVLLEAVRHELSGLNQLLSKQANNAELAAQEAAQNVQATIKQGRIWAIFLVGGSLLFLVLIVWLYIGHNIVARITSLNASMRSIASGDLDTEIQINGHDEIGAMALSLRSFRDQLSTLQEELVQSGRLAAVGQLSAGIAHEINQPLSAIRHYTRNSTRLIQLGRIKEAEENLTHINLLTKRIITTISQLKSMAKGQPSNLQMVDVKKAIDNAMLMLSGDKVLADTHLVIDLPEGETQVYADPNQLEQVIRNLITNALDAVSDNVHKTIRVNCQGDDDHVEIKVSDNGLGIPKALRKQILDPFFTTKKRGLNLGLGLSIAYNLVKGFGGKLTIDEGVEIGASFCIQLPRYKQGKHERPE
ncbi:two-component sensor histidine kinase [Leucothrix pacifica]|uniref:histidine kinase n=2 Tax=Leucothrix pacifica TaxID=1247513 RepID=A0A317CI69_9GAMM|nr:two-component sensor histidine kinase [Leucothrix pacifica]